MTFDPFALAGAATVMLGFIAWGAIRDKTFNFYFLIDNVGGAVSSALALPGLNTLNETHPWYTRFLAGVTAAVTAKVAIRQLIGKPIQEAQEKKEMDAAMIVVSDATANLSAEKAISLSEEIKAATTPAEVTAVIGQMVTLAPEIKTMLARDEGKIDIGTKDK